MLAGWVCKIVLGVALALLGQCRDAVAAKTPLERAREVMGLLAPERIRAAERRLFQQIQDARPVRVIRERAQAGVERISRLADTARRRVGRAWEHALMVVPAKIEAAWMDFEMAVCGDRCVAQAEI